MTDTHISPTPGSGGVGGGCLIQIIFVLHFKKKIHLILCFLQIHHNKDVVIVYFNTIENKKGNLILQIKFNTHDTVFKKNPLV